MQVPNPTQSQAPARKRTAERRRHARNGAAAMSRAKLKRPRGSNCHSALNGLGGEDLAKFRQVRKLRRRQGRNRFVHLRRGFLLVRRAGTSALRQEHLEDDAHRPPKHSWTGLRRHAERGQSQEQSLGEQGVQHGVRRQLKNDELGDDRSSVQRLDDFKEQFAKVTGGLLLRLVRPGWPKRRSSRR